MDALRAVCDLNGAQPRDHAQPAGERHARQTPHLVPAHLGRARGGPRPLHVPDQHRHGQDAVRILACRR